jgi:hypothetical protein
MQHQPTPYIMICKKKAEMPRLVEIRTCGGDDGAREEAKGYLQRVLEVVSADLEFCFLFGVDTYYGSITTSRNIEFTY